MNRFSVVGSFAVAFACTGMFSTAHADHIAYDNAAAVTGLQNYGNNLGLDFDVNQSAVITALGVFNNGDLNNLNGVVGGGTDVAIYDRNNTASPVSVIVHFDSSNPGTQINGDAFKSIAPLTLPAGQYSIVAFNVFNYNSLGAPNASSVTDGGFGGGVLSFVNGGRYGNSGAIAFPGNPDGGPFNRYDAGTFAFIPEPSSLGLLAAGLAVLGIARRRRTENTVMAGGRG